MTDAPVLAIVGLGYVGLPLAHAFAKGGHTVIGYDISTRRIDSLKNGFDWTNELTTDDLSAVTIHYTADPSSLKKADIVIMAIPTPVDSQNNPDLSLVESATQAVGKHLKKGAIVVYESTVYPGVTEEICGPILEKASGMICGKDFFLGYSPERINPGDKEHTVERIVKVVAGQDEKTLETLAALYGSIVKAGIHKAPNIKVAEMAKAIENAQRDLNIAFMNEIAMLCGRIGIATKDVLQAAATKWNFLRFQPGLVGGHCIGVDPYYLVEKAKQLHMQTHVITAGRSINDAMSVYVAKQVIDALGKKAKGAKALVLGLTFKENVPDTRNSKSPDVVRALEKAGIHVDVHDPYSDSDAIKAQGMKSGSLVSGPYDAVVLLVSHAEYMAKGTQGISAAVKEGGLVYDLKSVLDAAIIRSAGKIYMAL